MRSSIGRRGFLKSACGVSVLALAGCADPQSVLILEEVNDEDVAGLATEVGSDEGEVLEAAVDNGTYTEEGLAPPAEFTTPVVYEGRYYLLETNSEKLSEDIEYLLRVEYVGDSSVDGEVEYEELSEADREALGRVLPEGSPEGFEEEAAYPYSADERDNSVLVGEGETTVVFEGEPFSVETEEGPGIDRNRYTYTAKEVADSREDFVSWAKEEYSFVLSGLTDEEREVVEEAIDGGYYEGGTPDAFASVARRFRDHEAVESDEWGGEWLVEYDGKVYLAELRHRPDAIKQE